ncbi:glyoxalase superfamily protein [Amycolatopsis rhabdoformis]|uniref:Glyoxalase superfamily protein n=1 Tax=Amycolatopsis rhabdoformis TaxID=1448059 RepID=A0ABZ1HXL7_9PSEU|nr:glyoxalase superfamily protein [Amycolatopsis rhabdoformis]WSE26909.1 glyoxalase superfamily protein [Amycolatopsis rhabdoformis]
MAIVGVGKVVVGVEDQARAKAFWSETVGFTVTTDVPYDDRGNRWVEVTAPDGTVLVLSAEDRAPAERRAELPTSNVFFVADDIVSTYRDLAAKGVEFPATPEKQPWGWWAMFTDPEGNRFALQQRD